MVRSTDGSERPRQAVHHRHSLRRQAGPRQPSTGGHPDRGRGRGLSKVCRFGAQAREYYSVAQHALLVRWLVAEAGHPELALAALHHDSHEAYLCDIPSPLKRKIRKATNVYHETCNTLDRVIADAFGLEWPDQDSPEQRAIKNADNQALLMETARLLPDGGKALLQDKGLGAEVFAELARLEEILPPAEAEARFLEVHKELIPRPM